MKTFKSATSFVIIIVSTIITFSAFAQKTFRPGQTFRECKNCPDMVVVQQGSFTMSCAEGETKRFNEPGAEHHVSIRQFAVGKFEITRGQWAAFVMATNRKTAESACEGNGLSMENGAKASWRNPGFPQNDRHPVVCVTWQDAQDYIHWLSHQTGGNYRLLTEAEWEYIEGAAMNREQRASVSGNGYASYNSNSGNSGLSSGRNKWLGTSPVGSTLENEFGLCDMDSNVFQWVDDCYASSSSGKLANGSGYKAGPQVKKTHDLLVKKGTGFNANNMIHYSDGSIPARMIHSAYRNWVATPGTTSKDYKSAGLGFRVAKTL